MCVFVIMSVCAFDFVPNCVCWLCVFSHVSSFGVISLLLSNS